LGGPPHRGDKHQRSRTSCDRYHCTGEGDRASDRRPAHPSRDREAGGAGQARGRCAAPELSAPSQACRHHGGALHACPPVQTRALAAIGGVPRLIVPDKAKVAVIKACLYEPQINRTYAEMAAHYGTAVLPTRPRRPRDKAQVEAAVLIIERWILARLRDRRFYSLAELNAAIGELLHQLRYAYSRSQVDPLLLPLAECLPSPP